MALQEHFLWVYLQERIIPRATDFDLVTQTSEDRAYFDEFARESRIESKRGFIDKAADMVYNVADAETQIGNSRRETALNAIVLLLTSVTLLSVSSDVYDFVRDHATLIDERVERARVALEIALAILLLGCLALVFVMRPVPLRSRHRRQQVQWEGFVDPTHPPT